jgi:uncharacterized protein YaaN involved in tellurite resistance
MSSYDLFGAAVKPATATASQINLNPTPQAANIVPVQQGGKYVMAIRSAQTGAISKIGQDTGKEISQLSGQVLDKVRASDSGEFGTGMKKILDLTSGVKLDKLGEETGLISKLTGLFSRGKNAVTHQFDSVKDEITRVADGLRVGVARMEDEAVWLEKARAANEVHQHEYELLHADLLIVVEEEKQKLAAMPQDDAQAVADQRQRVESFERHAQKIFKLIHLTKLTTPEICGLQVANRNLIEKFNDLVDITIPAWGKQISLALIGARQAKDAAVAQSVDDKTNEFFMAAANMVHDTTIKSAQLLAEDSIKTETLVHMQNQMIDMIKQVNQIDEDARKNRVKSVEAIQKLDSELNQAMLGSK